MAVLVLVLVLASAVAATAQSPYIGASVLADVVRASGPEDGNVGHGEALGGALRVGAALGPRWGVELDVARSGTIEWRPDVTILATGLPRLPDLFGALPDIAIFPPPEIRVASQLSTVTTSIWWRQHVTERFDLVYLGGVAFARSRLESEVRYQLPFGRPGQQLPALVDTQKLIIYDTGVAVGLEGTIGMTDHLHLVPGVRMLSIDTRWIIRPAVSLQWRF